MCRRKKHFLFSDWNTLVWQGPLTLIWTSCKKNALMIVGMSMRTEVCQIHGLVFHKKYSIERGTSQRIFVVRRDWQKFKRQRDRITCVQKYGPISAKQRKDEKDKNGRTKSESSRTRARYERNLFYWSGGWRMSRGPSKNARKKLEVQIEAAMPRKEKNPSQSCLQETAARLGAPDKVPKTKYVWKVETHEPTRQQMEPTLQKERSRRSHRRQGETIPWTFVSYVTWIDSHAESDENSRRKGSSGEIMEKSSRQSKLGSWIRSRASRRLVWKHKESKAESTLHHWWTLCHVKNAELEPKFQKYKGGVVLRGDVVKDDSRAYAVFTEQGPSASQMTAAKVTDVIARIPDCDGQAVDAQYLSTPR